MAKVKPKKKLGQHFLHDQNISRKIVEALEPEPGLEIVEIGPGTGALTQWLVLLDNPLLVIEKDQEASEFISKEYDSQVILFHEDFLKWKMTALKEAYFIGNLPYNISSQIFFRLYSEHKHVKKGVFMVQKEVAERICAPPGSKTYGILSVLLGYVYDLKYLFTVSENVFFPKPKVKSGVFSMEKKKGRFEVNTEDLKIVVKNAFGNRRKTVRNAVKNLEFDAFDRKDFLFSQRAEQLSIDDFVLLTKNLISNK